MTLIQSLHDHAQSRPKSVAFFVGEDVWTYDRLTAEVERLAGGLAKYGLRHGNRVVLHLENMAPLVVAYSPAFALGLLRHP